MINSLSMHGPKILLAAAALAAVSVGVEPASAQTAGVGKLFTSRGTCSASVISGKNIIVTAAHCCYDRSNKQWVGGWSFAPAYNNGNTPYGMFPWSSARVLTSWVTNGGRARDVCLISLKNNSAGRPITYYTGWYGRAWNFSPRQNMRSFGYPGNLANGQVLQQCVAPSSQQGSGCGGDKVVKMACNMTGGSSGGPWFRDFGTGNHVNSVVSGWDGERCTGGRGKLFNGPRFTSLNIERLCRDEGC